MSTKLYANLKNFQGGLNAKDGAYLAADTEIIESENAELGIGFVKKRNGYDVFSYAPTQATLYLWNEFGFKNWSEV